MAQLLVELHDLRDAELDLRSLPAAAAWPRLAAHRWPWWHAIAKGLRHRGFLVTAHRDDQLVGVLPLMLVKGPIFGRFLVSLPYVNTGGVWVGMGSGVEAGSGAVGQLGSGDDVDSGALPSLSLQPPGGRVKGAAADMPLSLTEKPLSLTLSPAAGERGLDEAAGERGLDEAAGERGLDEAAGARGLDEAAGEEEKAGSLTEKPFSASQNPLSLTLSPAAGERELEAEVAAALVERACALADELDVKYLELRHESPVEHPRLNFRRTDKVHMRLPLPATDELLDKSFKSKLRSQVRKAGQFDHHVVWGGSELLDDFYDVFAVNMRDLGTPVFSKRLFAEVLEAFSGDAELCVVYQAAEKPLSLTLSPAAGERGRSGTALPSLTLDPPGGRVQGRKAQDGEPGASAPRLMKGRGMKAVAGALLVHADGVTEVPSASCLRSANPSGANMWMYRQLLRRAIERGSQTFDFGRSSEGSGTYKFKQQWGAEPHPAVWQYYVRKGSVEAMRPDSAGNQRLIRLWQKLPVWLTRLVGPEIVRGIP